MVASERPLKTLEASSTAPTLVWEFQEQIGVVRGLLSMYVWPRLVSLFRERKEEKGREEDNTSPHRSNKCGNTYTHDLDGRSFSSCWVASFVCSWEKSS